MDKIAEFLGVSVSDLFADVLKVPPPAEAKVISADEALKALARNHGYTLKKKPKTPKS